MNEQGEPHLYYTQIKHHQHSSSSTRLHSQSSLPTHQGRQLPVCGVFFPSVFFFLVLVLFVFSAQLITITLLTLNNIFIISQFLQVRNLSIVSWIHCSESHQATDRVLGITFDLVWAQGLLSSDSKTKVIFFSPCMMMPPQSVHKIISYFFKGSKRICLP